MLGVAVKECKSAKVKVLNRLITSTNCDSFNRIPFKNIDFSNVDFFVQNGMKKKSRSNNQYYEHVENYSKNNKIPILIRELPVLRQICLSNTKKQTILNDRWIRLSWNSFFMDEGLHPYDSSYDRWRKLQKEHNIIVYDWKSRGDYILFCLQLDGDSALNRLSYNNIRYKEYCKNTINRIKKLTDRPILIRSHPFDPTVKSFLMRNFKDDSQVCFSNSPDLYNDLDISYCMLTYNSTSSVESVLYGIPTIVLDTSAVATPVANKLDDMESLKEYDRDNWLKRIAFMQWQVNEMSDGYVWNLLKRTAELN